MYYIVDFGVGSILFLGLTMAFYFTQKRLHDRQDRIYSAMLVCSLCALVFDVLAGAMEPCGAAHPKWLLYAVNMLFLLSMQACLPAFFAYAMIAVGKARNLRGAGMALALAPFAVTTALLLLSPLGRFGIFYIDEQRHYQGGATHIALYIDAAIYLVGGLFVLLSHYRAVPRVKRAMTLVFAALVFAAMAVQMLKPEYLITTAATALALTAMYYALQSPGEMTDPMTEAYSRTLLPALLRDQHENARSYTLILHSLYSFDEMTRLYGAERSEALLAAYSALLRQVYPGQLVVYMDTAEFTTVCDGALSEAEIRSYLSRMPATLSADGCELPLKAGFAAVVYAPGDEAADTVESVLTTMDYLYQRLRDARSDELLLADSAFREECTRRARLEASAADILAHGVPELQTVEVKDAQGDVAWVCAQLALRHEAAQGFAVPEVMAAIGRIGGSRDYYQKLIAACAALRPRRVCLPLPSVACITRDSARWLAAMVAEAGMQPADVIFTMSEQDAATALPVVRENILALAGLGFSLQIDQFAEGYTDLTTLGNLPVQTVEIADTLLHDCRDSERHLALLQCVIGIVRDTGKRVVCAGADTAQDAANAERAGAELLHATATASA